MSRAGIWRTLGIDRTADASLIRRAYAQALRAMDPDADPEAFARLRGARDQALAIARAAATVSDAEHAPPDAEPLPSSGAAPDAVSDLDGSALAPPVLSSTALRTLDIGVSQAPAAPISAGRPDGGTGAALDLPAAALGAPVIASDGQRGVLTVGAPDALARYGAACDEVFSLLHDEREADGIWLDDVEEQRLLDLIDLLLSDPRMAQVDFFEGASRWFAEVLAASIPRSDPVLQAVTNHFGWNREMESMRLPEPARRVVERARSLAYIALVEAPDHPDHRLWAELTKPAYEKSRRSLFIRTGTMRTYLAKIRRLYPDAETRFDTMRVALWDRSSLRQPNSWAWAIGIVLFLRAVLSFSQQEERAVDVQPPAVVAVPSMVSDANRDIDQALLAFADGLTRDRVAQENPALLTELIQRWSIAAEGRTELESFIRDVRSFLLERFDAAVLRADHASIAALRRMDLAEIGHARDLGADACARYLEGALPIGQVRSATEDQMRRRAMAAIILATVDAAPRRARATYRIPGAVMERLSDETGLDRAALIAALDGRGPAQARCDARRALLSVALALPRATGLPILRAM